MSDQTKLGRFWAPIYWPSWLAIGFFWLVTRLPYRLAIGVGQGIGWVAYLLGFRSKRIARINIQLCLPHLSAEEQRKILKLSFINLGVGLVEVFQCWWAIDKLKPLTHFTGKEHVYNALEKKQGIILLTCHQTPLEVGGTVLSKEVQMTAMYREQSNKVFNAFMVRGRASTLVRLFNRNEIITLARYLRKGHVVWYAPDQNYSGPQSVFADFFNIPAATTSATARLARMTGSVILPLYQVRRADFSGYDVTIGAPVELSPDDDIVADTTLVNKTIETMILSAPDQYLWAHRRFKSRPEGADSFY